MIQLLPGSLISFTIDPDGFVTVEAGDKTIFFHIDDQYTVCHSDYDINAHALIQDDQILILTEDETCALIATFHAWSLKVLA